jgi:hypothetical protein
MCLGFKLIVKMVHKNVCVWWGKPLDLNGGLNLGLRNVIIIMTDANYISPLNLNYNRSAYLSTSAVSKKFFICSFQFLLHHCINLLHVKFRIWS